MVSGLGSVIGRQGVHVSDEILPELANVLLECVKLECELLVDPLLGIKNSESNLLEKVVVHLLLMHEIIPNLCVCLAGGGN